MSSTTSSSSDALLFHAETTMKASGEAVKAVVAYCEFVIKNYSPTDIVYALAHQSLRDSKAAYCSAKKALKAAKRKNTTNREKQARVNTSVDKKRKQPEPPNPQPHKKIRVATLEAFLYGE